MYEHLFSNCYLPPTSFELELQSRGMRAMSSWLCGNTNEMSLSCRAGVTYVERGVTEYEQYINITC